MPDMCPFEKKEKEVFFKGKSVRGITKTNIDLSTFCTNSNSAVLAAVDSLKNCAMK